MSLEIKRAKLLYIAQEMEAAQVIARHAPTPFIARIVARHVLTRAKDFIAIAQDVPSLLRAGGTDPAPLKARTKAYADTFNEYFATTRTKIAAHVQDVEWVERMEMWTDIEVVKVEYFVEGAREIYDLLGTIAPLGHEPYTSPDELADDDFKATLSRVAASRPPDGLVRAGADPLAATRPNTVAVLNSTPVHQRAGQLVQIDMWIQEQLLLWDAYRSFPVVERILRARLLTDIVSFVDCLRTRPDGAPAHRTQGLDDLVRVCTGGDASAIDKFRQIFRLEDVVTRLRGIRNRFGGHFHRDDSHEVEGLLAEMDAIATTELLAFYAKIQTVFARTCERNFFLGTYRINDVPLAGVAHTVTPGEYVRPFNEERDQPATSSAPRFAVRPYTLESFIEAVNVWVEADDDPDDAHTFIWNVLLQHVGTGRRHQDGQPLPEPHAYLLGRLLASTSIHESRRLLALIERCARGSPEPLAELLLAYLERTNSCQSGHVTTFEVCAALAELPIRNGEWARAPIVDLAKSEDPLVAATALRWLYRRLTEEGSQHGAPILDQLRPLLAAHSTQHRLLGLLAIGSLLHAGVLSFARIEEENQAVFRAVAEAVGETRPSFKTDDRMAYLLSYGDYASVCVLVGEELREAREDDPLPFFKAAAARVVIPSVTDGVRQEAALNRALAHLRLGEQPPAIALALSVFEDPLAVELQLAAVPLLLEAGVASDVVRAMFDSLKATTNIPPEFAHLVAQAEAELAKHGGVASLQQ